MERVAVAQGDAENKAPSSPPNGGRPQQLSYMSEREFWLSLEVLSFGVLVVGLQFGLLFKRRQLRAEEVLKVFGVTLILVGTLFAVTAGFSGEDIGPALGLFGTVAGYLLGRRSAIDTAEETGGANGDR